MPSDKDIEKAAKDKEDEGAKLAKKSKDTGSTPAQQKKDREDAEKAFADAAKIRQDHADDYVKRKKYYSAAEEEVAAAADWGDRETLNKEGKAAGEKGEDAEIEQSLQKRISALLRAVIDYARDGRVETPNPVHERAKEALKLKEDYEKTHPKSKLQLSLDGELKK
jgi:hypothetical protein